MVHNNQIAADLEALLDHNELHLQLTVMHNHYKKSGFPEF
jgi:hypothetical protein